MPSKYLQRNFKPDTYHHIVNRGCFKQKIFRKQEDYKTFLDILRYYLRYPKLGAFAKLSKKKLKKARTKSTPKPYTLLAYCLMPNHFHLLLFQKQSSPTLTNLLQKVSVAYAMYFQYQYKHSGALFQGRFKSVKISSDPQLLYLTKYIHLNPKKSERTVPSDYPYSSLKDYLKLNQNIKDWLDSQTILDAFFKNSPNPQKDYLSFLTQTKDKSKLERLIKNKTLE
ncbi:MAG: transposase [Candidatus Beckwithbacteria bacterium]|nr:transposase [Patescibacteria group bacterium]